MYLIQPDLHTRRAFLRRSAQLAATGVALPTAINLASMADAAAQTATDYKALVCIFLYGGNDQSNTLAPYDQASYDIYKAARTNIALDRTKLLPLNATALSAIGASGLQFGFAPEMTGLADLFNTGKAAVQLNVGPLAVPMSKAHYAGSNRTTYPLPPKLFSHNDQQSIWQSSSPEGSTVGWGGNVGDLMLSGNGAGSLFTCISVTGNAVFLSGDQALSYQVGSSGPVRVWSIDPDESKSSYAYGFRDVGFAMRRIATNTQRSNMLEEAYNTVTKRSIDSSNLITNAVKSTEPVNGVSPASWYDGFTLRDKPGPDGTPGPVIRSSLADQLRMVARLIAARQTLGVKRQVFFVSLGGFDLHDSIVSNQPRQMRAVSHAMKAFYDATVELQVANQVTAFTASDFGRTLSNNGDGTDHGWGAHHIVVGGAVKGGQYYGYAPPLGNADLRSNLDADLWQVGQGRLLPTSSVDQYAATLAKWFGVSDAQLLGTGGQAAILPNLNRFGGSLTVGGQTLEYQRDLGFMA
jgi:uncharacterized protein (DUF1501 family)